MVVIVTVLMEGFTMKQNSDTNHEFEIFHAVNLCDAALRFSSCRPVSGYPDVNESEMEEQILSPSVVTQSSTIVPCILT